MSMIVIGGWERVWPSPKDAEDAKTIDKKAPSEDEASLKLNQATLLSGKTLRSNYFRR